MKNTDIAAVLVAQKVMAALEVDPKTLAQVVNIMKTIADNGVPAVEIARVLSDGLMPKEMIDLVAEKVFAALEKDIQPADVDLHVKVYDNLKLKANIPQDVIEYIDNKLIQVWDYIVLYSNSWYIGWVVYYGEISNVLDFKMWRTNFFCS